MEENKKMIYIPTNIQTETIIFPGYGVKELWKTLIFAGMLSILWLVVYLFNRNGLQMIFEIMISIAVGVFIYTKDSTNQNVVDYVSYMVEYAAGQKVYIYDNKIEEEEEYIVRKYKEAAVPEPAKQRGRHHTDFDKYKKHR